MTVSVSDSFIFSLHSPSDSESSDDAAVTFTTLQAEASGTNTPVVFSQIHADVPPFSNPFHLSISHHHRNSAAAAKTSSGFTSFNFSSFGLFCFELLKSEAVCGRVVNEKAKRSEALNVVSLSRGGSVCY